MNIQYLLIGGYVCFVLAMLLSIVVILVGKEVKVRLKAILLKGKGGVIVDIKRKSRTIFRDVVVPNGKETLKVAIGKDNEHTFFMNDLDFNIKYGVPEYTFIEGYKDPVKFYGHKCSSCKELVTYTKVAAQRQTGVDEEGNPIIEDVQAFKCSNCSHVTQSPYNYQEDSGFLSSVIMRAKMTGALESLLKYAKPAVLVLAAIALAIAAAAFFAYKNNMELLALKQQLGTLKQICANSGSIITG